MKRLTVWILVLLCVGTLLPLTAHAGDLPESVLQEDAQLFFGEVLSWHPDKEVPSVSVSPVAVIKGDIPEGTMQHYQNPNPMGNFRVREGKVYLFLWFENANYIDLFEVRGYDTKTLKLRYVQGPMMERFEEYLNQGKYGVARVDGLLPYRVDLIRWGAVTAAIGIFAAAVLIRRKKRKAGVR